MQLIGFLTKHYIPWGNWLNVILVIKQVSAIKPDTPQ